MVISKESAWGKIAEESAREYRSAVVYADREQEVVLHEGAPRLLIEGGSNCRPDVPSPPTPHHVDPTPEEGS